MRRDYSSRGRYYDRFKSGADFTSGGIDAGLQNLLGSLSRVKQMEIADEESKQQQFQKLIDVSLKGTEGRFREQIIEEKEKLDEYVLKQYVDSGGQLNAKQLIDIQGAREKLTSQVGRVQEIKKWYGGAVKAADLIGEDYAREDSFKKIGAIIESGKNIEDIWQETLGYQQTRPVEKFDMSEIRDDLYKGTKAGMVPEQVKIDYSVSTFKKYKSQIEKFGWNYDEWESYIGTGRIPVESKKITEPTSFEKYYSVKDEIKMFPGIFKETKTEEGQSISTEYPVGTFVSYPLSFPIDDIGNVETSGIKVMVTDNDGKLVKPEDIDKKIADGTAKYEPLVFYKQKSKGGVTINMPSLKLDDVKKEKKKEGFIPYSEIQGYLINKAGTKYKTIDDYITASTDILNKGLEKDLDKTGKNPNWLQKQVSNGINNIFGIKNDWKKITEENKEKNFVKRALNPDKYPKIENYKETGKEATHQLAAEIVDGEWIVFPTIIQTENGELKELELREAQKYAKDNKEYISFGKNKAQAIEYSKNGLIDHTQGKPKEVPKEKNPNYRGYDSGTLPNGIKFVWNDEIGDYVEK